MIEKSKIVERLKAQIAVCHEIDSDWCSLTVGTCKRILELIGEREQEPEKPDPDLVRVIRCEKCQHYEEWKNSDPAMGHCRYHHKLKLGNAYCSNGEKKRKKRECNK